MLDSLVKQWPTAAGLVVFSVILWRASVWLGATNNTTLVQNIVLLDTLLVLWWYTHETARLAENAVITERVRQKPFAVVAREPLSGDAFEYRIHNVGSGLAVNVWWVTQEPDGSLKPQPLGALGPNDSRRLPEALLRPLCDQRNVPGFALLAEGLFTRTSKWTATFNYRGAAPGSEVRSTFFPMQPYGDTPIEMVLSDYGGKISTALAVLHMPEL